MNLPRSVSLVALVLAVGCEKSGPATKGSGAVAASESELLSSLPAGNTLLFGGNYMMFQKYIETSPIGSMMAMVDKSAPGILEWTNCWADLPNITMMGAVKVAGSEVVMRFAMKGVDLPALEKCAQKAS